MNVATCNTSIPRSRTSPFLKNTVTQIQMFAAKRQMLKASAAYLTSTIDDSAYQAGRTVAEKAPFDRRPRKAEKRDRTPVPLYVLYLMASVGGIGRPATCITSLGEL
jgi:hypothetical protein